jgi:hypothetical protein
VPILNKQDRRTSGSTCAEAIPPTYVKSVEVTRRELLVFTLQASAAAIVGGLIDGRIAQRDSGAAIPELAFNAGAQSGRAQSLNENRIDIPNVQAVQHVRRMRGGAQAHLFRCSDGNFYVVKFKNNPQHLKILANEMLATLLASLAGLPVPNVAVVNVNEWLIQTTPDLKIALQNHAVPCESGLQFGARYVVSPSPWDGQVFDYLPVPKLGQVRNLESFAGILAFDKWTSNGDSRQAAFWRRMRQKKYTVTFIDQGYCFNAEQWTFPDSPLKGLFPENEVYSHVSGWESFEPWLSCIEEMPEESILLAAKTVPPDWYHSEWHSMEKLVQTLVARRGKVRELITEFRISKREPFPKWTTGV